MLDYQLTAGRLSLSGQLKVQYLDILHEALTQAREQEEPLEVDLSQVREVDLAGLQLLAAWLLDSGGPEARLGGLSGGVERALALSGLKDSLAPFQE
ncbi:MAG: STAS domain-containing protein [Desulfarculaceae bacterium]|nr:STAS domain-containing protein [Desulfarculaceae bacterium]MCF8072336.1 STAS domain-containing protein [Desulfarculaceae bacterium]MCF8100257.1 STAS domain-containing protein [Desulfarculaceae bacterium]MCF8116170.1 STAS domain-containing protein [Desulfarculaceae bacterium]